jgi:hypothetical protein
MRVVNATLRPREDCWEYLVVARNETWGREEFRVLMQKAAFPTEAEAEQAILGAPLEEVKNRLESPGEEPLDLFGTGESTGWKVV